MKKVNKEPVKYIAETASTSKVKPTKDVFNYYVYIWGWDEALRVFNLTELQATRILFPDAPKGIGYKHLKGGSDYTIQGNVNPIDKAVHETVEYRNIAES